MQIVGAIVCILAVIRLLQLVVNSIRTQKITEAGSLLSQAPVEESPAAGIRQMRQNRRPQHWNGYRRFQVGKKVTETENTTSLYLLPHDRKVLPSYRPGQYLTFRFKLPGEKQDETIPVVRCYSLSDAPHDEYFRITVKRVPPPPGTDCEPGRISGYIHDNITVGDVLDVQAPRGEFALDPAETNPVVLVAGGVGVTPLLSMLNAIALAGTNREVWFFYGVRNGAEHIMREHLQMLDREHSGVHLVVCYSEPRESDRPGRDYHQAGHVTVDVIRDKVKVPDFDFYVCGPPPMMETLIPALEEWGVGKDHIHMEAFGPASARKSPKPKSAGSSTASSPAGVTVQFSRTGKKVTWDGTSESLLDLALNNGVSVDSGCRAGSCGTCMVRVTKGQTESHDDCDAECDDDECLLCVSVPVGDVVLDA